MSQAYVDGLFYVQDMTAAMVAEILSPEPGWVVADLCSAPGGKSVAMAMQMRDEGVIIASDIDADRLVRVGETARRLAWRGRGRGSCIRRAASSRMRTSGRLSGFCRRIR